jgi:hypothetical protein
MENKRKMPDPKKVIIKIDNYEFETEQYIIVAKEVDKDIHSLSFVTSTTTADNMLEELERHSNNMKNELKRYKFENLLKNFVDCSDCPERFNCDTYRKGEN